MYVDEKKSTYEIGAIVGAYNCTVAYILKENGIQARSLSETNRLYSLNEHYFDKIDTPNKAYILGFLYADGCNSPSGRTVKLQLQEKDKEILNKIKIEMQNDSPLEFTEARGKTGRTYILHINSKYIARILADYGMVPNKSYVLQFPRWLDKELLSHFMRGYYDGDGSISKSGNGVQCSLVSSEFFCDSFSDLLNSMGIAHKLHEATDSGRTKIIKISTQSEVKKFLDWIYKDADLYMERKYIKYYNNFYNKTN